MKTTTILKTLALALLMPTMLLTTACSNSDDIVNTEKPANTKGYALPVTINVTRQGGDATRAIYDESTKKLSFSTGDKLFIEGYLSFAGMLTMVSDGKFTGEILTETPYTGTVEDLLTNDEIEITAYLLPAGYENYGFLNIVNPDTYQAFLYYDNSKVFALTKKEAVEQLSFEKHWDYDTSLKGFELMPATAILNFTISGLAANTAVSVIFNHTDDEDDATPVNITTDASGVATFAAAMRDQDNFDDYYLTVDGTAIALPANREVEAGHIYNISRSVAPATNLSTLSDEYYEAQDGEVLTGTLTNNVMISIADGATVTLKDVNITNLGDGDDCNWAGITCLGDATLVLEGTNEVCAGRDGYGDNYYPGIWIAPGYTLTIQGDGTLTAYSDASNPFAAGIGGGDDIACGNIVINSGNITAMGGESAAGIGGRDASCGNITIYGGTVTATGGQYAAGIGSGYKASCGKITIYGGTVTATGGQHAAGIGTGYTREGVAISCGNITINGGTVTATGGKFAAGIGTGYNGGGGASCGNITISGGTVSATGGNRAAGIGSGECASYGNITISGGTITATGGEGAAGIGGCYENGDCGTITIKSTVTSVTAMKGNDTGQSNDNAQSIGIGEDGKTISVTIEDGANVTQE